MELSQGQFRPDREFMPLARGEISLGIARPHAVDAGFKISEIPGGGCFQRLESPGFVSFLQFIGDFLA